MKKNKFIVLNPKLVKNAFEASKPLPHFEKYIINYIKNGN